MIFISEVFIDWLKHAFVTKFNGIPIESYSDYQVRTCSFESEEIVPYHFSDINWVQGQNMSHLINCQCINGCLKTLSSKLKLVSCF